jgi:hypothetical protein
MYSEGLTQNPGVILPRFTLPQRSRELEKVPTIKHPITPIPNIDRISGLRQSSQNMSQGRKLNLPSMSTEASDVDNILFTQETAVSETGPLQEQEQRLPSIIDAAITFLNNEAFFQNPITSDKQSILLKPATPEMWKRVGQRFIHGEVTSDHKIEIVKTQNKNFNFSDLQDSEKTQKLLSQSVEHIDIIACYFHKYNHELTKEDIQAFFKIHNNAYTFRTSQKEILRSVSTYNGSDIPYFSLSLKLHYERYIETFGEAIYGNQYKMLRTLDYIEYFAFNPEGNKK